MHSNLNYQAKNIYNGLKVIINKKRIFFDKNNNRIETDGNKLLFPPLKDLLIFILFTKYATNNFFDKNLFIFFILIILTEIINTAIELICDFIEPKYNKKIRNIKDVASAFCFLTNISYIVYYLLFIKK